MEFTIKFIGIGYDPSGKNIERYAFNMPYRTVGIKQVKKAKKLARKSGKKFNLDGFSGYINSRLSNPIVIIGKDVAEWSRHFKETSSIEVKVPENFLNGYAKLDLRFHDETNCGFIYSLKENKLIQDWITAGCPLDWSI